MQRVSWKIWRYILGEENDKQTTSEGVKRWYKCFRCNKRFHLICHRNDRGLSLFINSDDHDEHVKNDQFTTAPNQISTVTETQLSQRKRRGSPPKKVVNTTKTTQAFTPEKTGTANTNTRKSTGNQNKTK